MDLKQNYSSLLIDLENQELSSVGRCSDRVYAQLMAIYLLTNDLQNAKLLWKRIPIQLKQSSDDLKAIWEIGKLLLKRKSSDIFSLIDNYEWPNFLLNIMKELKGMLYIQQDDELLSICKQMNWQLDSDEGILITKQQQPVFESLNSNQEHLEKLVNHVTFLEFV